MFRTNAVFEQYSPLILIDDSPIVVEIIKYSTNPWKVCHANSEVLRKILLGNHNRLFQYQYRIGVYPTLVSGYFDSPQCPHMKYKLL